MGFPSPRIRHRRMPQSPMTSDTTCTLMIMITLRSQFLVTAVPTSIRDVSPKTLRGCLPVRSARRVARLLNLLKAPHHLLVG